MIAAIQGEVLSCAPDAVIIMAGGVGYELFCTPSTLANLSHQVGQRVSLLAYTHVTDDAITLFGFEDVTEKQMYLTLLKVNGIGARTALHILSGARVNEISDMIERGDVKALSKLPKVGKKTAEQMILTLKGKLVFAQPESSLKNQSGSQITFALVNLGFRTQDVEKVVSKLPEGMGIEEGIRKGLAELTNL